MYDSERSNFKVEVRMLKQRIAELEAENAKLLTDRKELGQISTGLYAEVARLEAENSKLKEEAKAIVNRAKQLERIGIKLPDILHSDANALAALVEDKQDEL